MDFWERLKTLIKEENTTQEWVANQIGVSYRTFRGWISRRIMPNADQAVDIAKALNTTVEFLVIGSTGNKSLQRIQVDQFLDNLSESNLERAHEILKAAFPQKGEQVRSGLA